MQLHADMDLMHSATRLHSAALIQDADPLSSLFFVDSSGSFTRNLLAASAEAAAANMLASTQASGEGSPEEAWRLAASSWVSHSGYSFAIHPIVDIFCALVEDGMFDEHFVQKQVGSFASRWIGVPPMMALTRGGDVLKGAAGFERGYRMQAVLLGMLQSSDQVSSAPPPIASSPGALLRATSRSPLTRALLRFNVPFDPWQSLLRGLCVALCRSDGLVIDLPCLTAAIIAADARISHFSPPLAVDEDERRRVWGTLMMGAAAEFGQHALLLHACEVLYGAAGTEGASYDELRLLHLGMHNAMRREADWRFRTTGLIAEAAPGWLREYVPRMMRDRQQKLETNKNAFKGRDRQQHQQQQQQQV